MQIFETVDCNGRSSAVIESGTKIFARYVDLGQLADEHGIDIAIVREQMKNLEFPSAINHDEGIDGNPEDGLWMYDRVSHFIEWLSQNPIFNPRCAKA